MNQLSKARSVAYHLYPGLLITIGFIVLAPFFMRQGFPPQFGMMIAIAVVAVPVLVAHLFSVLKTENKKKVTEINGLTAHLSIPKLILYALGLVIFAFVVWGVMQPINNYLSDHLLGWLPDWYAIRDFSGYDKEKIKLTLALNLVLNGLVAPVVEELYFRGYLLPRMRVWGKSAFFINALLFSLYHFWQPDIYLTLLLSLLPMTYFVWKTQDLRLAIVTHSLLNLVGGILSFRLIG